MLMLWKLLNTALEVHECFFLILESRKSQVSSVSMAEIFPCSGWRVTVLNRSDHRWQFLGYYHASALHESNIKHKKILMILIQRNF